MNWCYVCYFQWWWKFWISNTSIKTGKNEISKNIWVVFNYLSRNITILRSFWRRQVFDFFQNNFSINKLKVKTSFWITFSINCKDARIFPYLTMALITGSRIFSQIGLPALNCGVLRFLIYVWKKVIKNFSCFLIIFYSFVFFNQCYFFLRNDFIR